MDLGWILSSQPNDFHFRTNRFYRTPEHRNKQACKQTKSIDPVPHLNPVPYLDPLPHLNPVPHLDPPPHLDHLHHLNTVPHHNLLTHLNPIPHLDPLSHLNPIPHLNPLLHLDPLPRLNPMPHLDPLPHLKPLPHLNPPLSHLSSLHHLHLYHTSKQTSKQKHSPPPILQASKHLIIQGARRNARSD